MSESESSFNATGPSVVAFETTSADTPVLQQFGVSVAGTTCGVYGQGTTDAQADRRRAPFGIGVLGRGKAVGVHGTSFRVTEDNTVDFAFTTNSEALGVVGVNSSFAPDPTPPQHYKTERYDSPAVLGDNDILGKDKFNAHSP
jgi:hypothetical protein